MCAMKTWKQWFNWRNIQKRSTIVVPKFLAFVDSSWITILHLINIARSAVEIWKLLISNNHIICIWSLLNHFFNFRCDLCPKNYYSKKLIESHMELKHKIDSRRNICKTCGKEFRWPCDLRDHELIHLPDELKLLHPCPYCDMK